MGNSRYHKWVVLLSSYIAIAAYAGYFCSQGAVFVIIMNRFNSSRLQTSVIQFLAMGSSLGSGLFVGMVIHKVGVRRTCLGGALITSVSMLLTAFATSITQLIVSFGIFLGLGISAMFIGCTTAVGQHFEGHKFNSIVLSIVSTGSSVGGAIYPFLIQTLSDLYAMPGVCLVVGAILLNGVALPLLWKSPNTDRPLQPQKNINKVSAAEKAHDKPTVIESLKYLVRQGCFWTYALGLSCLSWGTNQIPIFIVDLFLDKSFSETSASLSLLLFSVFSAVGRLLVGFALRFPPLISLIIAPVVGIIGICGIWFSEAVEGSLAFICLFGVCNGVGVGATGVTTFQLFGVKHMSNAIGLLFTISSIGMISTGVLNGYIRDVTNSYAVPMFVSIGLCSASFLLFVNSHYLKKRSLLRKMEPKRKQITKSQTMI